MVSQPLLKTLQGESITFQALLFPVPLWKSFGCQEVLFNVYLNLLSCHLNSFFCSGPTFGTAKNKLSPSFHTEALSNIQYENSCQITSQSS